MAKIIKMKMELSTCCNALTTFDKHWQNHVCVRCERVCDTYETEEEYFDEIRADDERLTDDEINQSISELP